MVGVDIVEVERVVSKDAELCKRILSEDEQKYLNTKSKNVVNKVSAYHNTLAGFFAAKEAVLKAFGLGISGVNFKDIQILHKPSGQPYVKLSDNFIKICGKNAASSIHISIAHDGGMAISVCLVAF